MATTSIPFWQFTVVSAVGIIYECAVFAYFGRCAGRVAAVHSCASRTRDCGVCTCMSARHQTRERSAVTFVGPNLHHRLTTRTRPPATRSMADNIHAIVKGEGGPPPVFEWVMLGVSALMCVVGAIFVSYSIK